MEAQKNGLIYEATTVMLLTWDMDEDGTRALFE
jgi:hypothetical protein